MTPKGPTQRSYRHCDVRLIHCNNRPTAKRVLLSRMFCRNCVRWPSCDSFVCMGFNLYSNADKTTPLGTTRGERGLRRANRRSSNLQQIRPQKVDYEFVMWWSVSFGSVPRFRLGAGDVVIFKKYQVIFMNSKLF